MLDDQGDVAEAREHYQRVIGPPRPADNDLQAHVAAAQLEVMLFEHGEFDSARALYERVTDHGQPEKRTRFAFNRAQAWKRRGNMTAAAEALREIITEGLPRAHEAAYLLGNVLRGQGDLKGAHTAFQFAVASDDPAVVASARAALGLYG